MPQDKTGHYYYSWFPTIYARDTQHLTLAEDGAYRRLIDYYMTTRAPLPGENDRAMARILGVAIYEWEEVRATLKTMFKPSENPVGLWVHSLCEEILAKQGDRIGRNRENGAKGGRPKKQVNQADKPTENPLETQHKPIGTYTKQSKAALSKNISPLPPSVVHSSDLSAFQGKDFNDFQNSLLACSLLMGVPQLSVPDQETLCAWLERYDMNTLGMPTVAEQMVSYRKKNGGQRPKSLAYFDKRLAERQMMRELAS